MNDGRRSCRFHFVDVFAVEPLTGNPLAVVEDAADLTVDQLQRIAREFNQHFFCGRRAPTRIGGSGPLLQQEPKCSVPEATTH